MHAIRTNDKGTGSDSGFGPLACTSAGLVAAGVILSAHVITFVEEGGGYAMAVAGFVSLCAGLGVALVMARPREHFFGAVALGAVLAGTCISAYCTGLNEFDGYAPDTLVRRHFSTTEGGEIVWTEPVPSTFASNDRAAPDMR